jgi:hypothetical protein
MMHFSCQTIAIYGVGLAFVSKSYPSFGRESFIASIICPSLMTILTILNVQSFAQCKRLHIIVSAISWRDIQHYTAAVLPALHVSL